MSGDAEQIDVALVSGQSHRQVAEAYRRSPSAVDRHAANHLPATLIAASDRTDLLRQERVVARLETLLTEGEQVLRRAKERGSDDRLVLAALRELREMLAVLARLTPPSPDDSEFVQLVTALARMLPSYPGAAMALAGELRALGAEDAADAIGAAIGRGQSTGSR